MADEYLDIPDPIELRTNADWRWVTHISYPAVDTDPAGWIDLTGASLALPIISRKRAQR